MSKRGSVCPSCGAVFAIDYDDSDVEHERIKTEAELEEKRQEHEKEMLEREFELREQAEIRAEKRQAGTGHKYVNGKAGWGWPFAKSFEDYDQCYRENVTALGGNVSEVK